MKDKVFIASVVIALMSIVLFGVNWFNAYQPFKESEVTSFPTDKIIYHPGDRIVFNIDICSEANKFDEVTFQLQKVEGNHVWFQTIGSFKSISLDGCYVVSDLNPSIPTWWLDYSPGGTTDVYVISHSVQNVSIPPKVYKTQIEIQ